MSENLQCPKCSKVFCRKQRLISHLKRQTPCGTLDRSVLNISASQNNHINQVANQNEKFVCSHCQDEFYTQNDLVKHIKRNHAKKKSNKFVDEFAELKSRIIELENRKPVIEQHQHNNNQILQVMCVANDQNYLDMLAEKWGFDKALDYIKGCALSDLSGDCRLLEKIYFEAIKEKLVDNDSIPIYYTDKSHGKVAYLNERKEPVSDYKGKFLIKKLANNLQNSYLKGVNHVITSHMGETACQSKLLEDYDIQLWNRHIYVLSDEKYQKKLLASLDIPEKPH